MSAADVLLGARRRAGLSQTELARRLDTTASALSRWEHGHVEPSFRAVEEVVRACGLELEVVRAEAEPGPGDEADRGGQEP